MMEQHEHIDVENCCTYYQIEVSFFNSLEEAGLIHVRSIEGRKFIPYDELTLLEKFIRLHYELNINLEGLEAINHMLDKMERLQQEVTSLRRRSEH